MSRPDVVKGETIRIKTGCGHLYVIDNTDDENYKEFFLRLGKPGGCAAATLSAIAMLGSVALRNGMAKEKIIKILSGIRCTNPSWENGEEILSCVDAVARVLGREK